MLTFLIVPMLVCGIIWIQSDPKQSFKISTYQGWLVYLHAAKFGFFLIVFSYLAIELTLGSLIDWVARLWPSFDPEARITPVNAITKIITSSLPETLTHTEVKGLHGLHSTVEILSVSIISVFFTYLLTRLFKGLWNHEIFRIVYLESFWRKHSIFDHFILKTMQQGDFMQVSLENNKCYVGIVNKIQEPNEETTGHKHISLTPILSGYRHKETQSMIFTNRYPKDPARDNIKYNDAIIIPIDKIINISGFDFKIYNSTADNLLEKDDEKPSLKTL